MLRQSRLNAKAGGPKQCKKAIRTNTCIQRFISQNWFFRENMSHAPKIAYLYFSEKRQPFFVRNLV